MMFFWHDTYIYNPVKCFISLISCRQTHLFTMYTITDNSEKPPGRVIINRHLILSSSKELTSWIKLQVEIFCKASRRHALQKISTCSLEDDNVFVFCVVFF